MMLVLTHMSFPGLLIQFNVKSILDDLGMSYIWISQNPQNSEWLANTVLQKSPDQYKQ